MPAHTKYSIKYSSAYTLVEILVALTIIGLLFSFGFVSFRDFSRRQAIADAAKMIQGDLRLAQGDAMTGQKPNGCTTTLDSYSFNVQSLSRYTIEANCAVIPPPVKDVTLPSDITITAPYPLKFKVLGQGTNITGTEWVLTLTQVGTGDTKSVTVTLGGEIK
jgi:prepilin-type N-terminal cleavage/methylation domain-containing protein